MMTLFSQRVAIVIALAALVLETLAFLPATIQGRQHVLLHQYDDSNLPEEVCVSKQLRRTFLTRAPLAIVGLSSFFSSTTSAANAAEPEELPTKQAVQDAFDSIRYELSDSKGGVSYMQSRIDEQDFAGLMEFTKGYDLELRKKRMGGAKKMLQDKDVKSKATEYANAVTFDLIGINRNSRKGQENAENANKYLQELRDDVNKFLNLESTIQVQS
jgi:hypothetical protein